MEIGHIHTQRVAFTPAHIQLSCDGIYMALPLTRTSVGVWSLQNISYKPLELVGHSKILTSLALGNVSVPKLLVSSAEDYVIVWNLQQARQQLEKGDKIRGKVIGTTLGYIQYSAFSPDDSLVAVCTEFTIVVLQTMKECKVATLEGHNGTVTGAEFCPHYTSTLVSISDDRTYKVWNLEDLTLVYQSPILTASPFLSMAMSLHESHVAIGTADGMVRVFDLTDGNDFRCLHQIDVSKIITKQKENKFVAQTEVKKGPVTVSSRPTWKQPDKNTQGPDTSDSQENIIETGHSVLGLYFTYLPQEAASSRQSSAASSRLPFLQKKSNVVKDLLNSAPMLLVGTTSGLLQVNTRSLDMSGYVDFQESMSCTESVQKDEKVLNAAGSVIFGQGADHKQIWCIIGSPFQNVVHILRWSHAVNSNTKKPSTPKLNLDDVITGLENNFTSHNTTYRQGSASGTPVVQDTLPELTVLSTDSLLDDSPLRSELTPRTKDPKENKPIDFVATPPKGKILDKQPLTFKTKIKSSGYSEAPRMTMFKPKTSFSKPKTPTSRPTSKTLAKQMREYPIHGEAPSNIRLKIDVAERPTPVNCIKVSDDGQNLACALANKSALVFSLPLSHKGSAYTGHNHIVTSVDWSHCGSRLLTSSDDKTASLWVKGQSDPVMTFDTLLHNFSSDGETKDKTNKKFSREVHCAQFYYMDKFILLCSGNTVYLYKYYIDTCKNEIKRYLCQSKYKLVQQWAIEAQQMSALSAINSFYSYIMICAGSNKSIQVYDMNVGQKVRSVPDVHSRPVHAICQNEGSQYVSHPSSAYDLFVTAAAGDCIKLWDLRSNKCVRRYEGHLNRVHPCGVSFSPCGRFIATGSEDKCTYIFDLRSGTYIHKLTGQTDVVSDVTFHPLHPQLFTASLDGKIFHYTNR